LKVVRNRYSETSEVRNA